MNFLDTLETTIRQDDRFVDQDGKLAKTRVVEAADALDQELLRALYKVPELRKHFFTSLDEITVFDKEKFQWVLTSKEFLPDSYTKYRNKIGLSSDDSFLLGTTGEVTLVWPFKDCFLEGGQSTEEEQRNEVFYNETLAPEEVGRLLSPKAFRNAVRYTVAGKESANSVIPDDNLIIKGNNLLALASLLERFRGQVQCIYIDPPYNTGSDSFQYNDRFNHSTWLTFMRNRLLLAKKLLCKSGIILVQCDDQEQAYLKVLMDEVIGRENFVNVITVKTKIGGVSGSSEGKSLKDEVEYINLYFANKANDDSHLNPEYIETDLDAYIASYKASGKSWKYTTIITKLDGRVLIDEDPDAGERLYGYKHVETMSVQAYARQNGMTEEEVYKHFVDRIIRTTNAQSSVRARVLKKASGLNYEVIGLEYIPRKGRNAGEVTEVLYKGTSRSMVMRLSDAVTQCNDSYVYRERVGTLWTDIQYNNLTREGAIAFPNGKKPEALIRRILRLATQPGDLVLDFHLGSGTTAAVAHKMGRRYIGIEQMDYIDTIAVPRLQKVIEGENSGVSQIEEWTGGGSFVYVELADNAERFMHEVKAASNVEDLKQVLQKVTHNGLLKPALLPSVLREHEGLFESLSFEQQQAVVAELIDKNRLYVNASDIDDDCYDLSEEDKAFTRSFYEMKDDVR